MYHFQVIQSTVSRVRPRNYRLLLRDTAHSDLDPPGTRRDHIGRTKAILWTLYAHSDSAGVANPSLEMLCEEAHLGKDAVITRLAHLEERGWISRTSGGGRKVRTQYRLLFPAKKQDKARTPGASR